MVTDVVHSLTFLMDTALGRLFLLVLIVGGLGALLFLRIWWEDNSKRLDEAYGHYPFYGFMVLVAFLVIACAYGFVVNG